MQAIRPPGWSSDCGTVVLCHALLLGTLDTISLFYRLHGYVYIYGARQSIVLSLITFTEVTRTPSSEEGGSAQKKKDFVH